MKCIIVDDEPLAREGLALKVKKAGFLYLIGQFSGGLEANRFLAEHPVDLMFLDIQMPDITGLDLLRTLKHPPMIILTTAYSDYAIEGFELDAIDYLLKPIDFQRFMKAINKAKDVFELQSTNRVTLDEIAADFIYLRADRQFVKVFFRDIRYVEGMKNYVMIHTLSGEKHMTAISLQLVGEQLPLDQFARVNKSFIVNVGAVRRIVQDFIVLDNGAELPFGKAFQEDFIARFVKGNLLERK